MFTTPWAVWLPPIPSIVFFSRIEGGVCAERAKVRVLLLSGYDGRTICHSDQADCVKVGLISGRPYKHCVGR